MAEKTMDRIPREVRLSYNRATEALQRQNYDYAITLLQQILEKEPGLYDCRHALRAAQLGKAGGKSGFLKKVFKTASFSQQYTRAQVALHTNPVEAIKIAEQILNDDPHNSTAHKIIADAALALEMPQTAALSLEILVKNSSGDRDRALVLQLAEALRLKGDIPRAEKYLSELQRRFPNDGDINQALKNLSARRTLHEGGYEALSDGSGSYRDILRNKEEAVTLEQEKRQVKSLDVTEKLIGEYETRLKTEPDNLKLVRSLAELYTQKQQFDRALEFYQRIKNSEGGNDPSLERGIAETTVRKFDHQIAQLEPNAPGQAERIAALQAEKLEYQMAECKKRVERFPTDLAIRFEMGLLYQQAGRFNEAIQEFQKAQSNPHKRIPAMFHLAQCFSRKGIHDLAARSLQNAIKEKVLFDDEKKELLYELGSVFEKMGRREQAIDQFKAIYEQDIAYRDVAAKMDAFYTAQ